MAQRQTVNINLVIDGPLRGIGQYELQTRIGRDKLVIDITQSDSIEHAAEQFVRKLGRAMRNDPAGVQDPGDSATHESALNAPAD